MGSAASLTLMKKMDYCINKVFDPPRMNLSVLEFFTIGIGPSIAYGGTDARGAPLRHPLERAGALENGARGGHLYGSLALTGRGHGNRPRHPARARRRGAGDDQRGHDGGSPGTIRSTHRLRLGGTRRSDSTNGTTCSFTAPRCCPRIPMACASPLRRGECRAARPHYYSIGGGFVVNEALRNVMS